MGSWILYKIRNILIIYVIFCIVLYFVAPFLIFHPTRGPFNSSFTGTPLKSTDGTNIFFQYLPNPVASHTILFFHGNADRIDFCEGFTAFLHRLGFNVLALEYRGYGPCEGRPTEVGVYRDAAAARKWLTEEKKIPPESIIFYGISLGGAVAIDCAVQYPCAGLIIQSTFTSVAEVRFPVNPFPYNFFKSGEKIKRLRVPALIMHGAIDRTINVSHGRTLHALCPDPKIYFEVEDADHVYIPFGLDPNTPLWSAPINLKPGDDNPSEEYRQQLQKFMGLIARQP